MQMIFYLVLNKVQKNKYLKNKVQKNKYLKLKHKVTLDMVGGCSDVQQHIVQ